ncbi:hypothetical protein ABTX77_35845 [Streptomyces sp. NPDC097704]|uniref:hypothetical protein n=1 Tax=Streptomyces sp. NPDC097704 TaxID=3157101 RepID=UPI0033296A9D
MAHSPVSGLKLKGFPGDSERDGHRRLYFTKNLDYYAEFAVEDVQHAEVILQERPPFRAEEATEVTLREGAVVTYTRNRVARPSDDFDLDFRRRPSMRPQDDPEPGSEEGTFVPCPDTCATCWVTCQGSTCGDTCEGGYSCFYTCPEEECTENTCNSTECTQWCCQELTVLADCGPSDIETACATCDSTCVC